MYVGGKKLCLILSDLSERIKLNLNLSVKSLGFVHRWIVYRELAQRNQMLVNVVVTFSFILYIFLRTCCILSRLEIPRFTEPT